MKQKFSILVMLGVIFTLFLLVVFYGKNFEKGSSQAAKTEKSEIKSKEEAETAAKREKIGVQGAAENEVKEKKRDSSFAKGGVAEAQSLAETRPDSFPASKDEEEVESSAVPLSEAEEEPIEKEKGDSQVDSDGFIYGKILPKKGLEEALLKLPGVQLSHAMEISNAIRFEVDLTQIKAGEDFKVKFDKEGMVEQFVYYPDVITFHILTRDPKDKKLKYSSKILPTERRFRIIEGAIDSSLNETLVAREDVTRNIRAVTIGILECIVSFRTDARKGDKYRILVEERFYRDKLVPGSKILYASYEGKQAGFHEAFRFEENDAKSAFNAHYTKEGKALIPSAMRLPVDRVHVTSPFGMRRHPITGRMTRHEGVDYGGPVGAPVYAVAQGKVVEVKTTRYGGKQITIEHADKTKTYYLHLNSFLTKKGRVVSPRQKIGTIGKTGRVTGPHLHFGIKDPKGNWLNPQKIKMIAAPKLDKKRMVPFKRQMAEILSLLSDAERYQEWLRKYDEGPQSGDFYQLYPEN